MNVFLAISFALLSIVCSTFVVYGQPNDNKDKAMLRKMYDYHLSNTQGYEDLRYLATRIGGRLSGSPQAEAAVVWASQT